MSRAEESLLAWSLVEVALPKLDKAAKTWACTHIGAGECRMAIEALLRVIARYEVDVPFDVASQLHSWLRGYRGSDREESLRRLVEKIPMTLYYGSRRTTYWVR